MKSGWWGRWEASRKRELKGCIGRVLKGREGDSVHQLHLWTAYALYTASHMHP
jgi:hypothetical protein